MTISELLAEVRKWSAPVPHLLADDGRMELWDHEGSTYFRRKSPLDFSLPAIFYGARGFYRIDHAESRGGDTVGRLSRMTAGQWLTSHLLHYVLPELGKEKKYPAPKEIIGAIDSVQKYCDYFGGIVVE